MEGASDAESEFVEWGEEAEELGDPGADGDGEEGVPDEKSDNGVFGDLAFFPSDFGVSNVGDDGGDGSRNKRGEPEEVVVFYNDISKERVESEIKNSDTDADKKIPSGVLTGLDVFGFGGGSRLRRVGLHVL